MEEICSSNVILNTKQKQTLYEKLSEYSTPLCRGVFQTNKIYEAKNPSADVTLDMCPYNNNCKDNKNYVFLNQRGVPPSPWFKTQNNLEEKSTQKDARLVDTARNYTQQLDIKPIQVYYDLLHDNVSQNPALRGYGKNYKDYSSVTGGQIQYYIDKQQSEPFYRPVYAGSTDATGYMWKDPMDAVKPQFEKSYANVPLGTGLSWLDDSCAHRDDITSFQQRKHNEQKYQLVYNRM